MQKGRHWGRCYRLWRCARLQVPRRRPRKRIAAGRPRPQAPTGANQVWFYDFVFDWCANGQQLKCLTVTDEWTKEGMAIEVDGSIRSGRAIEVLARLVSERGAPLYLHSDNGPGQQHGQPKRRKVKAQPVFVADKKRSLRYAQDDGALE